jgi:DNA-binding SARP family transcriptional activator
MELLWPGLDPVAAANNLHHALHVARRVLQPVAPARAASRYLPLRDEQLALCPDGPLWVDGARSTPDRRDGVWAQASWSHRRCT